MRMLGLKTILLAAGLTLASAATAAAPQTAPAVTEAPGATDTAPTIAAGSTAAPTGGAPAPATPVADPLSNADGTPITAPVAGVGLPVAKSIAIQDQVSPTGRQARVFHDAILMPIITIISLFVLALLIWVVIRYRRAANPVPSKTSHNTGLEVAWTLIPVLILAGIALPSFSLLANQFKPAPENAVTLKAIGNQWFWSYEYPDHGGLSLVSNMLREQDEVEPGQRFRTDADGPRLMATDNRVVLPTNTPIRLLTTANDVIHAWAIPAFWIKLDAVPGRINETSFTIEKPGLYYGQCSELCGARHAYMPITVQAVSPAEFEAWVRAKGGTMPGDADAAAPADTLDATDTPAEGVNPETIDATAAGVTTNQSATGTVN